MAKLIEDYDLQLVEPGCAPGATRWNALLTLPNDISAVFPYLNARHPGIWYDHENQTLIWREPDQTYACRPREIRIAVVQDPQDARQIAGELIDQLNRTWEERESITPSYTEKQPPSVIALFKLLPQTNCKECGRATCLAFAADLSQGKALPEDCPPLCLPENAAKKEKIALLFP
ncbi:MAG: (Fe-S)-binding protein [Chloroflexota bacterium]